MKKELRDRYYYGISEWPSFLSPEAEIVYKSPRRQQQLVKLAQAQIQVQRDVADEIERSSVRAAEVVAAEIRQQTTELSSQVQESLDALGDRVAGAFLEGVGIISNEIGIAADRICAELSDIKWQLAQQQETLTGIFGLLYESRSNDARQLVSQGVRLYAAGELTSAKSIFLKALDSDATDYQALMNLGYLALEDNDFDGAAKYFKKALKLPRGLTRQLEVIALNALARLHYSNHDFENAFIFQNESVRINQIQDPEDIYKLAIYAFLSGKKEFVISNIQNAISMNSIYFSKAAVEPDLAKYRDEIVGLLSRISGQAKDLFLARLSETKDVIKKYKPGNYEKTTEYLERITAYLARIEQASQNAGYSELRSMPNELLKLRDAINEISFLKAQLVDIEEKRILADKNAKIEERRKAEYAKDLAYTGYENKLKTLSRIFAFIFSASLIIAYVLIGIKYASIGSSVDPNFEPTVSIVWPIALVLNALNGLFEKGDKIIANAGGKLVLIALGILVSIWLIFRILEFVFERIGKARTRRSAESRKKVSTHAYYAFSLSKEVGVIQAEVNKQTAKIDKLMMTLDL